MAARNMGGLGALQVKNSGTDGAYYTRRHVVGKWKHVLSRPTFYKMRGFNASTNSYEFWLAISPGQGPPSGASLTNITIAVVYNDSYPTNE